MSLRESGKTLRQFNVAYFGASCDPVALNEKFAKKLDLDFPLLSDTDKKVAAAYGILSSRGFSSRVTFIIDESGKIAHIFDKVSVGSHGKDIAEKLKELKIKPSKRKPVAKALSFKMKSLEGKDVDLAQYSDKVVLMVNVASQCGLTGQYTQLQDLHSKYADKGLAVLGFPCNQFGGQEPGSAKEISTFCKKNYGVEFDMFSKVEVNGDGACDLYKHLTKLDVKPKGAGNIGWNFEKFLLDRSGKVIARFAPTTSPDDAAVLKTIETALATKAETK